MVLIVVGVAGYGVYQLTSDDDGAPDPVDIVASEPEYTSVEALSDASDRVVDGFVLALEPGRSVTNPDDPTVGVRTQLVTVKVERTIKGAAADTIVIEQEATLLDGTPITVNGVAPLVPADRGRFYLVDGDGEQFPYAALTTVDGFVASDD